MDHKLTTAAASVGLCVLSSVALHAGGGATEEEAVRRTAGYYIQGHATGDGEQFRKAFHPEAKLFSAPEGRLTQRTSAEFIAGAAGHPAKDESQRRRRITSVDIAGGAALVKVELDYPEVFITDYLSLLKLDGEWKVVNKIFDVRRKMRRTGEGRAGTAP